MKYTYLLLFVFIHSVGVAQENWVSLIQDEALSNFEKLNGAADFEYKNGILTGITKPNTPNTFLTTKQIYGDFILEFEVKIDYGVNSGVQFRSEKRAGKDQVFGYQAEIETTPRKWAGGIYDQSRRGWIYPLSHNPKGQAAFVNGTWNKYRIEAHGNHIKTWINGVQCVNLVDDMTSEGFIAFQVHDIGNGQGGQKIQWKNIRMLTENVTTALWKTRGDVLEMSYLTNQLTLHEVRQGWRLLWDGKTTKGWKGVKSDDFPSKGWFIKDEMLCVEQSDGGESENGGDIITVQEFTDFELVLDFRISEGANSGIKYFVDPSLNTGKGSAYGLEFQILDDKNHPDAGKGRKGSRTLGSLYDLIPASNLSEVNRNSKRYNQGQFNRARVIVRGGKVEHWLNEVKVVEYDRYTQMFEALVAGSKYAAIKDFGQLAKGHILLQDHGSLVEFKNIKIREL